MPYCDDCRFSSFDFTEDIRIDCALQHHTAFFAPSLNDTHLTERKWGWHRYYIPNQTLQPIRCPDFSRSGPYADTLDPPHGPTSERLPIRNLDGLDRLTAKYHDAITAGRLTQQRIDDGDPTR